MYIFYGMFIIFFIGITKTLYEEFEKFYFFRTLIGVSSITLIFLPFKNISFTITLILMCVLPFFILFYFLDKDDDPLHIGENILKGLRWHSVFFLLYSLLVKMPLNNSILVSLGSIESGIFLVQIILVAFFLICEFRLAGSPKEVDLFDSKHYLVFSNCLIPILTTYIGNKSYYSMIIVIMIVFFQSLNILDSYDTPYKFFNHTSFRLFSQAVAIIILLFIYFISYAIPAIPVLFDAIGKSDFYNSPKLSAAYYIIFVISMLMYIDLCKISPTLDNITESRKK